MKKTKVLAVLLLITVLIYPISSDARVMTVSRILSKLTNPSLTTIEKTGYVDQFKEQTIKGSGKVVDILKSHGATDKAMIKILKRNRGRKFDIIVIVDRASVAKIRKGKKISFEGTFKGVTFKTVRIEDAKITGKGWFFF